MNYQAQLNPWTVYRLSVDLQRQAIARFRTRNDAESYLKVMEQVQPQGTYALIFEAMKPQQTTEARVTASTASTKKTKRQSKSTATIAAVL
jgi:hypothetical protein